MASAIDIMYIISAVCFNLLVIGIYIFSKKDKMDVVHKIGIGVIILSIPFGIVFFAYLLRGKSWQILVFMAIIMAYFALQWWLDFYLKSNFRENWKTHVPYIILFYIVEAGLIYIAFEIGLILGYVVSISFWALLGALVYSLVGKKKKK